MAAVHLAHEQALNRMVALKVMSPAIMMGDGMIERFHQEARTQANLSHAHIVGVHSVRQREDLNFFVMQYVPGRSLQQVIRSVRSANEPLPFDVIRALLYQIGSAVGYAHRKGVIHRDIKPANILLNADGDAVVTDFGIAKVAENPSHTMTGTVIGTPQYMSPEQCYAAELTGASDQYSLGVVAYELIAGRPPFTGSSFAVMQMHTLDTPPDITTLRPDCPSDLAAAVHQMLAKKRDDRFPTISSALTALGAMPTRSDLDDPVRRALVQLADVAGVKARLGDILRRPATPLPSAPPAERRDLPIEETKVMPAPTVPRAAQVLQLRLSDPPGRLEVGETLQLSVIALSNSGEQVPSPALAWKSSDSRVASVASKTGVIEAKSPGFTDIVVTCGEAVAIARLNVREATVVDIELTTLPDTLEVGDSFEIQGVPLDARRRSVSRSIKWGVRDSNVATLNTGSMTLTAKNSGTAVLTGAVDGVRLEWSIRVIPARAVRIDVEGVPELLGIGEPLTLRARIYDKRGTHLGKAVPEMTVLTPEVVAAMPDGTLRGVTRGRAEVRFRCDDVETVATFAVGVVSIAQLEVDGLLESVKVGSSTALRVRALDLNKNVRTLAVEWSSSHPEVAEVIDGAILTARAEGETVLRARCGTMERSFPITVVPVRTMASRLRAISGNMRAIENEVPRARDSRRWVAAIALVALLAAASWALIGRGRGEGAESTSNAAGAGEHKAPGPPVPGPDTLNPNLGQSDGSGADSGGTKPEKGDSGKVVDRSGGGAAPGTTDGKSAPSLENVAIGGAPKFLEVGEQARLSARPIPANAKMPDPVRWRSLNMSVATIGEGSGVVTSRAVGTVEFEASAGSRRARVTMTIVPPRVATLSIEGAVRLTAGDSAQLSVVAKSARDETLPPVAARWVSSRPDVATVDARGMVHAINAGTAEIRAEFGGQSASTAQLVSARAAVIPPIAGPKVTPGGGAKDSTVVKPAAPSAPPSPNSVLQEGVAACQAAIRSPAQNERAFAAGSSTERGNADRLIKVAQSGRLTVGQPNDAGDAVVSGASAYRAFSVEVGVRGFTGRVNRESVEIRAVAVLAGDKWSTAGCRIAGNPKLQ